MIVPLLLGALLNTVDQRYFPPVQRLLHTLGAPTEIRQAPAPRRELWEGQIRSAPYDKGGKSVVDVAGHRFLNLGSFSSALAGPGTLTLIGGFLFCVGAQMNFKVGGRSLKKGWSSPAASWPPQYWSDISWPNQAIPTTVSLACP